MRPLSSYAENSYSQFGEDGILKEILTRLSTSRLLTKWCVEFGAWDGVFLSNTCRLIREDGFRAVLIEGDPKRVSELESNFPGDEVTKLCAFVGLTGATTLDSILKKTAIPHDFDVLSVDIDGCDYHVWESLDQYRPKVVIIEYNPTMPNSVEYVQPADLSVFHGSSPKSLCNLACTKGYGLVAVTSTNLFFVADEHVDLVTGSNVLSLNELRDDHQCEVFLFSGHDGTLLLSQDLILPYHNVRIPAKRMQIVPKPIRRWPSNKSLAQKLVTAWFRFRHDSAT